MLKPACAVAAAAWLAPLAQAASAPCGATMSAATRQVAEQPPYQVAFAPRGRPIAVGRHFALDIEVCPQAGTPLPRSLAVDADMPAHQHGMNYRASVKPLGTGRYRADGLMFHMPGRWRVVFDLATAGGSTRVTHEFDVE
jgi:hypothetical protein